MVDEVDGQLAVATKPKQHCIFTKVYDLHDDLEQKMYKDQTDRFPVRSDRGNQYIMVLIDMDGNSILVHIRQ